MRTSKQIKAAEIKTTGNYQMHYTSIDGEVQKFSGSGEQMIDYIKDIIDWDEVKEEIEESFEEYLFGLESAMEAYTDGEKLEVFEIQA